MKIVLATLMLLWGNLSAAGPDVTLDQLLKPELAAKLNPAENKPAEGTEPGQQGQSPQPESVLKRPDAPEVKGIYVTAHSAGGSRFEKLLQLVDETNLNGMVIDIKDDWGNITYLTDNEKLQSFETTKKIIPDMSKMMAALNEREIYPIARIVVFKDSVLAAKKPEWSYLQDGKLWKNGRGESFVNPYVKEVWEYNVEVAKEAAKAGFKEIQFDYVRFPEGFEKRANVLTYAKDERTRVQAVTEFVKYAREQLNPLGVRVSVDIFGYAASVPAAEGIGQDFVAISKNVDVISPMIYPSHYGPGWFGQKVPDAAPYATIAGAIVDTHKKLQEISGEKPIIRPWIQDFTAPWIKGYIRYGKKEIEAQIQALLDNNVKEYMLWNAGNSYTPNVEFK